MPTLKQIQANRKNSRLSTGPRTAGGKSSSSRNALKHGFASRRYFIRDDQRQQFEQLREGLIAEYNPRSAQAWRLFEQALFAAWNLRGIARAKARLLENHTGPLPNPALRSKLQMLRRYQATHGRAFDRALEVLRGERAAAGDWPTTQQTSQAAELRQ